MFTCIDHIGVAVADLDAAIELYGDVFEMPLQHRETVAEQGVEAALVGVGDSHVELLAPLGDETPVGRFLSKRGPGLHHTAYRCPDVADALDLCRSRGVRLIDERPRRGIRDSRVAFLHPSSTGGVLTELVEPASGHAG
jgi:methylmalonyl-CoA/ethylmalonyl-CoA epimerase